LWRGYALTHQRPKTITLLFLSPPSGERLGEGLLSAETKNVPYVLNQEEIAEPLLNNRNPDFLIAKRIAKPSIKIDSRENREKNPMIL